MIEPRGRRVCETATCEPLTNKCVVLCQYPKRSQISILRTGASFQRRVEVGEAPVKPYVEFQ